MEQQKIFLTDATGYIGGRLLPMLEDLGYPVRCLTPRASLLNGSVTERVEIVEGNVLDLNSILAAMAGIDTAFYFVHFMGSTADFEGEDRQAAQKFSATAKAAGVKRIIYRGGLGNRDSNLSKHLRSRQETGDILRASGIQVIELRASIVIGSRSLSFEIVRALTERLPVMICPKWVRGAAQPIATEDMLSFLSESVEIPATESQVFEIGGPDQVTYGQIMREYARQRKLRRLIIPVPLLTPYLSSLWLGLVTPLYACVACKMIDSMKNATIVSNNLAKTAFKVKPRSVSEASSGALINEDREFAATPLVGRALIIGQAHRIGWRSFWLEAGRFASRYDRGASPRSVCCHPTHRWPERLVLRKLDVARTRLPRSVGRWSRRAARSPPSNPDSCGGRIRFLARGSLRSRSFLATAG